MNIPSDELCREATDYLATAAERHDAIEILLLSAMSSLRAVDCIAREHGGPALAETLCAPLGEALKHLAKDHGKDLIALYQECLAIAGNVGLILRSDDEPPPTLDYSAFLKKGGQ